MGETYIPRTPPIYHRGFVDGYEHAQKDSDNDTECELAAWELLKEARKAAEEMRDRGEEMIGDHYPLPWENR